MAPRRTTLVTVAVALAVASCGGSSPGSLPAAPGTSAPQGSTRVPPSPLSPAPSLPPIIDVASTEATTIEATDLSDWIIVHGGSVWVIGLCDGVGRLDPASGAKLACANIPDEPCGAMDAAFGSVWAATCAVPGIARIDPATSAVTTIPLPDAVTDSETSIGAGEGGIWVIVGVAEQFLVKVDPTTGQVAGKYGLVAGARGVRVGFGSIWVTNAIANTLTRINPADGTVRSTIGVGKGPLFMAVDDSGVWVLNQGDGTVSHVDPVSDLVIATIAIGPPFTGDVAVGDDSVWVRTGLAAGETMVVRIDPRTDRIVERYGPAVGGGGIAVSDGVAWISSEDQSKIWRLPIR